jgi:hypothetical protein
MTSKIGSTRHLEATATAKHAPAVVEVAHSIAGRPRILWEMAHGDSAVSGELAMAPTNPQGAIGVDLSGPPFGACLLLPVVTWSSAKNGGASGVAPTTRWGSIDDTGVDRTFRAWNRPHATRADGLAPLQRFMLAWYAQASGAGSTVWQIDFATPAGTASITRTIATTTASYYEETTLVPMVPGRNAVRVRWRRTSGSTTLSVFAWSLLVAAKRRHGLSFPG